MFGIINSWLWEMMTGLVVHLIVKLGSNSSDLTRNFSIDFVGRGQPEPPRN